MKSDFICGGPHMRRDSGGLLGPEGERRCFGEAIEVLKSEVPLPRCRSFTRSRIASATFSRPEVCSCHRQREDSLSSAEWCMARRRHVLPPLSQRALLETAAKQAWPRGGMPGGWARRQASARATFARSRLRRDHERWRRFVPGSSLLPRQLRHGPLGDDRRRHPWTSDAGALLTRSFARRNHERHDLRPARHDSRFPRCRSRRRRAP